MGPVLLQEETGVPGENLRRLVDSNRTVLFSYVTKVTLTRSKHDRNIDQYDQ